MIVLESGGLRRSADTDRLNQGESNGIDPASLVDGRGRVFGGATALWAGQCLPPDRGTFEERPWIPHSGWPFEGPELEPFQRRAEALFQIEGEVYDERVWDGFGVERPPLTPARWSTASRCGVPGPTWGGSTGPRSTPRATCGCCSTRPSPRS